MPISSAPVIQPHTDLAQSSLADAAGNIAYWLSQTGGLGGAPFGSLPLRRSTVAASAAINTAETVIVQIPLLAGTTLGVGTVVRFTLHGTCTTTVANAGTITIRAGTAGTTADASVAAVNLPVAGTTGTNIPFEIKGQFNVQTLGAAGTCFGSIVYVANAATGLSATNPAVVAFTSSTLATTTATWLDVDFSSAATTTTATFQDCSIELIP